MEPDPTGSSPGEAAAQDGLLAQDALINSLKHRHRNQIQNMTSLVGLFGRRQSGACRDAFADLRARFEAISFGLHDEIDDRTVVSVDLPGLALRLADYLDPDRRHSVTASGESVRTIQKHAGPLAQIVAELLIDLYRRRLPRDAAGAAEVAILAGDGGSTVIRVAASGAAIEPGDPAEPDLGWSIAETLARSLGGELVRGGTAALVSEARIPAAGLDR